MGQYSKKETAQSSTKNLLAREIKSCELMRQVYTTNFVTVLEENKIS